jgi:hypothetical protein
MKFALFFLLLFSSICYGQEKPVKKNVGNKFAKPLLMFDIPIKRGMFDGLSTNLGFLLGSEDWVQIGILAGYRVHQKNNAGFEVHQLPTASILWVVKAKKIVFIPMFTYANRSYQDVSMRIGHSIDKDKSIFVHIFGSLQMGYGIGTTVKIK